MPPSTRAPDPVHDDPGMPTNYTLLLILLLSPGVTATGRAAEQFDKARSADQLVPGRPYFVRWKPDVTTEGEIGPRGPGAPALLVREVLELQPAAEDDCGQRQKMSGPGA